MNKMLDKEDFTMMKRAIFATQVLGPLRRGVGSPRGSLPSWVVLTPEIAGSLRLLKGCERTGGTSIPRSPSGSQLSHDIFCHMGLLGAVVSLHSPTVSGQ